MDSESCYIECSVDENNQCEEGDFVAFSGRVSAFGIPEVTTVSIENTTSLK